MRCSSSFLLLAAAAALHARVGPFCSAAGEAPRLQPRFLNMPDEEKALQHLKYLQQQQQQQQEKQQPQKQQQQEDDQLQEDVEFALTKGWWRLAQAIILYSHDVDADVASRVRRVATEIRNNLIEVERLLSKQHDAIAVMSPAFQWAESPLEVFLNIKFAYRWSSPGALSLEDSSFSSGDRSFAFSGLAQHSGVKRKYLLELPLFKDILPEKTKWNFASVGKVFVSLRKKELGVWGRLTPDNAKIANMNVWLDMREKVQKDVEAFHAGNYTIPADIDAGGVGQQQQQQQDGSAKGEEL